MATREQLLTSLQSLGDVYWGQGTSSQGSSYLARKDPNPAEAGASWAMRDTPSDKGQPEALCVRMSGFLSKPPSCSGVAMHEQLC